MVKEWTLNLENTGGRQGLKDPLGYKQDITDISVIEERDSTGQRELYEKVSIVIDFNLYVVCLQKAWDLGKSPIN